MFKKISDELQRRFSRKDELSKQLEIVKIFDILKKEAGATPVSLRNKTLVVQTSSSAASASLRLREAEILRKINEAMGKEAVKRVIYRF
ncbi:MAG: DciA family protein [bacterium]|nr:DciA family protein [bacterium]